MLIQYLARLLAVYGQRGTCQWQPQLADAAHHTISPRLGLDSPIVSSLIHPLYNSVLFEHTCSSYIACLRVLTGDLGVVISDLSRMGGDYLTTMAKLLRLRRETIVAGVGSELANLQPSTQPRVLIQFPCAYYGTTTCLSSPLHAPLYTHVHI